MFLFLKLAKALFMEKLSERMYFFNGSILWKCRTMYSLENSSDKALYLFFNVFSVHLMRLTVLKLFLRSTFPLSSNLSALKTKHLELYNVWIEATPKTHAPEHWSHVPPTSHIFELKVCTTCGRLLSSFPPWQTTCCDISSFPIFILCKFQHNAI